MKFEEQCDETIDSSDLVSSVTIIMFFHFYRTLVLQSRRLTKDLVGLGSG